MKKGYIFRNRVFTALTGVLASIFLMSSCKTILEDLDSCPDVGIWVQAVLSDANDITTSPSDVKSVRMYVFDDNDDLLEIRDSRLETVEYFDYPNIGLRVVMFANVLPGMDNSDPILGGQRSTGYFSLKQGTDYGNMPNRYTMSNTPGDIFLGEKHVSAAEAKPMAYQTFDVPIKRISPGVFVRFYGLTEFGAKYGNWYGPFTVVVEAEYDQIDLFGNPAQSSPGNKVYHKLSTMQPAPLKDDVLEFPAEDGKRFIDIVSSNAGSQIKLKLYNGAGDDYIYPIDDVGGSPIMAYSGKMCVVEVYFRNTGPNAGDVDVRIQHPTWGYIPPIDKDF